MSYQDQAGGYPPPPREGESQYPPPPGEEDDRRTYQHQRAPSSGVTLPSISPYEYTQPPPNGYSPDPRGYAPDPYRQQAPPPGGQYPDRPPYDYNRAPQHQQPVNFAQSAPRQRTAIACRYCRRRKIRCSGFDQNPDGRCINCTRFQQECIFTPVSSQAQAFVPAHAVYPGMRNMAVGPDGRPRPMGYPEGTQLYGAHGQPLGPIPQPVQAQAGSPYSSYAQASPTGSYGSFSEDRPRDPESRSSTSSHSGLQPPQAASSGIPSRTPPPRTSPSGDNRSDPMSLGSIMERRPDTEIDRSMLGRLGRRGQ